MQQNINIDLEINPIHIRATKILNIDSVIIPYTANRINQLNISIIESKKKIEWITKYPFYVMQYIYIEYRVLILNPGYNRDYQ